MNHSIINAFNLKEEEIDSIESVSSFHNEDFLITLKLKDHICPNCGSLTRSIKDYKIRRLHMKIFIRFNNSDRNRFTDQKRKEKAPKEASTENINNPSLMIDF